MATRASGGVSSRLTRARALALILILTLTLTLARWRFLEAGLWGALPASYFTRGRYLTFTPPISPPDPAPCRPGEGAYVRGGAPPRPCGGEDPHHGLGPKRGGDTPAEEVRRRSSLAPTPTLIVTLALTLNLALTLTLTRCGSVRAGCAPTSS